MILDLDPPLKGQARRSLTGAPLPTGPENSGGERPVVDEYASFFAVLAERADKPASATPTSRARSGVRDDRSNRSLFYLLAYLAAIAVAVTAMTYYVSM